MSTLGFNKKKEEVIAVFDVGSASVGGMIIKTCPESKPEVITNARIPIDFLLDVNFEAFWRCARNSLKKVIAELLKDSPRGVDKIFCTFSSPWFISQTRIIKVKREKSFEITDDFLKKLIDNEIKIFESQWQSKNHHSLAGGAANKCE
ncbi:MAG TPA: hypothetical protein ENG99_00500, partial [bacterium]|nr:hypothetical protein [bacterium]